MKTMLTYGTFNFFHISHINILEPAKSLENQLLIGLSTDEFNTLKYKQAHSSYQDLKNTLKSITFVNQVISERSWQQKELDIKKYGVDIFIIGYDWKGKFDHLNNFYYVIYKPRTANISTSQTKEQP